MIPLTFALLGPSPSLDQLARFTFQLEAARSWLLEADAVRWPEQLLADYKQHGRASELARMLATAQRIRDHVDRVVVLGDRGICLGAQALMEACREPYFNELSRAERGSRPRMYFAGDSFDNDAVQGLLHLLGNGSEANGIDERWAIVVIDPGGESLETKVALQQFLAVLRRSCGTRQQLVPELVVPVTRADSPLFRLTQAMQCRDTILLPASADDRLSLFTAAGLLPAALLRLDVVQLLEGMHNTNERFRNSPLGQNPVLDYANLSLALNDRGRLRVWSKSLASAALWYEHLRTGTAESTDGKRFVTHVIVDRWRHNPLPAIDSGERTWPELMRSALAEAILADQAAGRITAELHLPLLDEAGLGQFLQMLLLSTALVSRVDVP